MTNFFKALLAFFIALSTITAQELEKTWQFESIKDTSGQNLFNTIESDTLRFDAGKFMYSLDTKNKLRASGDYLHQSNVLVLYYSLPKDTIRHYRIKELTDSTLVFTENNIVYSYKPFIQDKVITNDIIPSQGFTLNSIMRGALGMLVLLLIAVFPANIYLAQSAEAQDLLGITQRAAIIRLPLQIPLLLVAYWTFRLLYGRSVIPLHLPS